MALLQNDQQWIKPTDFELLRQIEASHEQRIAQLVELTKINSGSLNPEGINAVGERFAKLFAPLCDSQEVVDLPDWARIGLDGSKSHQRLGKLWRMRKRRQAPIQILLIGHLDTVFPSDSTFQNATFMDDTRLNAPGCADMKGGILLLLSALNALEQHPGCHRIGWTLLLTPDEEIGSPGSAAIIQQEALTHDIGFVYEPALPNGHLAGERKGSGNFTLTIRGKAAHAGREPEQGRNALLLAAEVMLKLNTLNGERPELTLNPGILKGGETTNQVPDLAVLKFNIRIKQPDDALWCKNALAEIVESFNQREGYQLVLDGGFGRMPKQFDQHHQHLYQWVSGCAGLLHHSLHWQPTGGCCDGNNLTDAGLPNVDTLGALGQFIHSHDEFIELDSLTSRAQLSALLFFQLIHNGLPFNKTDTLLRESTNHGK